jgi:choline dehydrogenase-like flavoprotein
LKVTQKEVDAIVVGSGPGGATVAKELTQSGKRVLILEWGNNAPVKGTARQAVPQLFMPGKSLLLTNELLSIIRGITTGGSSLYYYATAFDPPVDMLQSYGVDIRKEIDVVRSELPIGKLSDDLIGPMAKRIMQSACDLNYQWHKLPKFIYQDKCRADCDKCTWGCPYGAKWNTRMFVEEAVRNGATLINEAKVDRVIQNNGKAIGVQYRKKGKMSHVYAPLVILSAGGMGTPKILRRCGIGRAGYDFFYDPVISVLGVVDDIQGGKEVPMVYGVHMEDEGYLLADMTFPWAFHALSAAQVFKFPKIFAHAKILQIMIKIREDLGGSLTEYGVVRKRLTQNDKKKFASGYHRAKAILENAGAKDIYKSWYSAGHPGGTAKIGDVVDRNLMTEIDNLYVCDNSVIPEALGLPPTFTLVCLAKRLAKHLVPRK